MVFLSNSLNLSPISHDDSMLQCFETQNHFFLFLLFDWSSFKTNFRCMCRKCIILLVVANQNSQNCLLPFQRSLLRRCWRLRPGDRNCVWPLLANLCGHLHILSFCLLPEDYIFLLRQCPSTELIRCLTQEWNGKPAPLSLGITLLTLLTTEQKIYCLRLLEELVTEKGEFSTSVEMELHLLALVPFLTCA